MHFKDIKVKNFKIQFYETISSKANGTVSHKRKYPYRESTYTTGGLWAYVRQLSASEKFQSGMTADNEIVSADINYNTKINSKMKAVFGNKVYDVGVPDNYEFKKEKTRVLLTLSSDKNKYTLEDEFDE